MRPKRYWGKLPALLIAATIAAGCSSNDIDPDELPAELVKFEETLRIKKVWSRGIGDGTERLRLALRPATDGTNIYAAAHDGRVLAMDAATGKRLWTAKTDLPLSAGPGTDGTLVVAGSSNGDIVALEAGTGEVRWQVEVTSEVLGIPAVAPGKVVVQTVNGKLTALDAADGTALWSVQQSMPALSVRGAASPVIARGYVISGFDNGRIVAYDLEDGGELWNVLMEPPAGRTELDRLIDVNGNVVVAGNDVYAASYQGRLGAVALESGQLLWSREFSNHSGFAIDFSSIYATDARSEVAALSRGSGRELWRRKDVRNRDASAPAIHGNSVVVGDFEGYLHWFDLRTGELQARAKTDGERISTQPLVLNDLLYVMTEGGSLYAFRIRADKRGRD